MGGESVWVSMLSFSEILSSSPEPIDSTMNRAVQAGHFTAPEWLFGMCRRWSHSGHGISRFSIAADFFFSPLASLSRLNLDFPVSSTLSDTVRYRTKMNNYKY